MEVKSINDVPNEVIQKNIMGQFSYYGVKIFGMTCWRFKVIADDELEKRRKQSTRILISCGFTTDGCTSKSGVLSLRQKPHGSVETTYEQCQNYFTSMQSGFGVNCNGRIICGAGREPSQEEPTNPLKKVFEFRNNNFVEIKPLTTGRSCCSSIYIPPVLENHEGLLLVAGSWKYYGILEGGNTMEYLIINKDFKSNNWNVCDDNLPCSVGFHQMNLLQNKLILTGGNSYIVGSSSNGEPWNKVWQGIISFNQRLQVNWTPLPPMMEERVGHVAIVIQDKLFCIGGEGIKSTEYFCFETNCWLKGPDLPFTLYQAKAVLTNQQNKCFLLGGWRDTMVGESVTINSGKTSATINLFDPIKGIENIEGCLDIPRDSHIAVLL